MINIIVAMASYHVIGKDGGIPWRLPEDMAHFKMRTMGHPVIMGRKTWQSLPEKYRPLPGRENIVISTTMEPQKGIYVEPYLHNAIERAKSLPGHDEIYIIGGGTIYSEALKKDLVDRLIVSHVHQNCDGDVFFPAINYEWVITSIIPRTGFTITEYLRQK